MGTSFSVVGFSMVEGVMRMPDYGRKEGQGGRAILQAFCTILQISLHDLFIRKRIKEVQTSVKLRKHMVML
jgi:hypothetical protein